MDLDRRKFIIGALKAAGVVGGWEAFQVLHRLGGVSLVKEAQAANIFINGHAGGSSTPTYATWKENTEIVSNSAVWLMEGGAAANETGVDSRSVPLTGADLVGTQTGNLAAATGSPPSRLFDGTDDSMAFTTNALDVLANGTNTWSIIIKGIDITEAQAANHDIFYFYNVAGNVLGNIFSGGFQNQVWVNAGDKPIDGPFITAVPTTGLVHLAYWGDDTYVRCGWVASAGGSGTNGQPTKWSDFPANNRLSATGVAAWANGTFNNATYQSIMRYSGAYTAGKIFYVLMSDKCLIDNAA